MTKLTRRGLAKGAALAAGGLALHVDTADAHGGGRHRPGSPRTTTTSRSSTATSSRSPTTAGRLVGGDPGDRIVEVGRGRSVRGCKRTIDLRGATVIPGLIDSHQHFIRGCHNPGYETRAIEAATSVAELQAAVAARARTGARRRHS